MNQNVKDAHRDRGAASAVTPLRQPDRSRLVSIGNAELQDLKNARVDGHLKRYRIIETGRKRSTVEVDDDDQVDIALRVAKSGMLIDRNPVRSTHRPPASANSGPRGAEGSSRGQASRPPSRGKAPPKILDLPA